MHRFRGIQPSIVAARLVVQTFQTLVVNIERCQQTGLFRDASASDAAQVIWSACHGYVSFELHDINVATDRDATIRLLLATLRDGFR